MKVRVVVFAALVVAACSSGLKDTGTPIKELSKQKAPAPQKLPIQKSAPVEVSPESAEENYRKILELAPDVETKAEAMRRLADLQIQVDESGTSDPKKSAQVQQDSINLYNQLLTEKPDDRNNDRVLYQLSRAYQNTGHEDQAVEALGRLEKQFPDSQLIGDAHFRRAELLFHLQRFDEASTEYKTVMDMGGRTAFFEPAQYKYGWSLFKQSQYEPALVVFCQILDRELPPGVGANPQIALAAVDQGKRDVAKDALRVAGLSFAALGGGEAVNEFIQRKGEPRFFPLLYNALGEQLAEKQRYTDAAKAYGAFTEKYPMHPLAPSFQSRVIKTYADGGFSELVVQEKEKFATTYDPSAPYWNGRAPLPEVMSELRGHLDDLAKFYHARAQANPQTNKGDFVTAANWYRRILKAFPNDPKNPETNFLLAESLYDGGQTMEAAKEYTRTAYEYPAHARSAEAAYAAVLAYQRNTKEAADHAAALRLEIDNSKRFAGAFPNHEQVLPVLTRTALALFEIKSLDEATQVANQVISAPKATPDLKRQAWSVVADASFQQKRYPESEVAYTNVLQLTSPTDAGRKTIVEQLAASIYKQGEAARSANDLRTAVNHFLRVGKVVPEASIRPTADYDAAAGLITLQDWPTAANVLEGFRANFPKHQLIPDVDKKLAVVYEKDNRPHEAAGAYQRIAARTSESPDIRREASWQAATLYDKSNDQPQTVASYEFYIKNFTQPVDRALDARVRLAEIYKGNGDQRNYLRIQQDFIAADAFAGAERSDKSKTLAARASLELGRNDVAAANAISLTQPLNKSIAAKKVALEKAINTLSRAAGYGIADVTTAATYEIGALYQAFSRALLDSERPKKMTTAQLEQYSLLLEEQSFPFEEKAIQAHESNLRRISQGVYDDWVKKSQLALAGLAPGKYSKREQGDEAYEALK
ncbi:MAG TPA: tetratricopeptide repeat protein [Nevskiaceae bacterium]|nr:tetratricopeptide repeat protein [Nevskiaceae bacterium]